MLLLENVSRKWTLFPIQWRKYKFDTEKYRCDPVDVSRWENSNHHVYTPSNPTTEWLRASTPVWDYHSIDGAITQNSFSVKVNPQEANGSFIHIIACLDEYKNGMKPKWNQQTMEIGRN